MLHGDMNKTTRACVMQIKTQHVTKNSLMKKTNNNKKKTKMELTLIKCSKKTSGAVTSTIIKTKRELTKFE